jgi:hypothetical protein
MKRIYLSLFLFLSIGCFRVFAQTVTVTAPDVYFCNTPTDTITLPDIIFSETGNNVFTTAPDSLVLKINIGRYRFPGTGTPTLVKRFGPAGLGADTVYYLGDTAVVIRHELTGGAASGIDSIAIRGLQVELVSPGVAELLRIGGSSPWPGLQLPTNAGVSYARFFTTTASAVIVNAGSDQSRCLNQSASLTGVAFAPFPITSQWTSTLSGSFSNATSLNSTYSPSVTGNHQLILTVSGSPCGVRRDTSLLTVLDTPAVVASTTTPMLCSTGPFSLGGSLTNAPAGIWSAGGGSFSPNANFSITPGAVTYTPTPSEIALDSFPVVLTATGSTCPTSRDTVFLKSDPKNRPQVNAGPDRVICAGDSVILSGSALNLSTATLLWTKVGANPGTFTNPNSAATVYQPSQADRDSGTVLLVLSTVGGDCGIARDTMLIQIRPLPLASLTCSEADTAVCTGQNISFTAFGGASFQFLVNSANVGGVTATATFTSNTLTNGQSVRARVFTNTGGTGCSDTTNAFLVRVFNFPSAPTWNPSTTSYASNATAVNLATLATPPTPSGGVFSGTGVSGNFFSPSAAGIATHIITYTISTNGCSNSIGRTFAVFDANAAITGLAPSYCISAGSSTISYNTSFTPPGFTFQSVGFVNPLGAFVVLGINPSSIPFNPAVIASPTNGGTGLKTLFVRFTNVVSSEFFLFPTQTRINPLPVVTLVNKFASNFYACEDTRQDTIEFSPPGGNFNVNGRQFGSVFRYNTSDFGSQPFYCPPPAICNRILTYTFTDSLTGCTNSASHTYGVDRRPSAPLLVDSTQLKTICQGDTFPAVTVDTASGFGNSGLFWFDDASLSLGLGGVAGSTRSTFPFPSPIPRVLNTSDTVYVAQQTFEYCFGPPRQIIIPVKPKPVITLQRDTICSGDSIVLKGSITNINPGTPTAWRTNTGGIITDSTVLDSTYYKPSATDISNGFVNIRLAMGDPDGLQGCRPEIATVQHRINTVGTVNAGPDLTLCLGNQVNITASLTGVTSGAWTGGLNSSFLTTRNSPTALFRPDSLEIADYSLPTLIPLTFTTIDPDGPGPCGPVADAIIITLNPRPLVTVRDTLNLCQAALGDTTFVILDSLLADYKGLPITLNWSANGGISAKFTDFANSPQTELNLARRYAPDSADFNRGFVRIVLTANDPDGPAPCTAARDSTYVRLVKRPIVNAGVDTTICEGSTIRLYATVEGNSATQGEWSSNTGGTFVAPITSGIPGERFRDAFFIPSQNQVDALQATLTWTADNIQFCPVGIFDEIRVNINRRAVISAGPDLTICSDDSVVLQGSRRGSTLFPLTSTWLGGAGDFPGGRADTFALYKPAASEIPAVVFSPFVSQLRNFSFILRSSDPDSAGPCPVVTDTMRLTINPKAVVIADTTGADTLGICFGETVQLKGRFGGGASSILWAGGVSPNGFLVNGRSFAVTPYSPDSTETNSNSPFYIRFIMVSNDPDLTILSNGPCQVVRDTVVARIDPRVILNAGPDQTRCNTDSIILQGNIGGAASNIRWFGGSNVFSDSSQLNARYFPSAIELQRDTSFFIIIASDSLAGGLCEAKQDSMRLTLRTNPTLTVTIDSAFCNLNLPIQGSLDFTYRTANGSVQGADRSFSSITSSSGGVSYLQSSPEIFTFTPSAAGNGLHTYTFELIRTAAGNFCRSDTSFSIIVHPQPIAGFSSSSTCVGDTVIFSDLTLLNTLNSVGPNFIQTWSWDFNTFNAPNEPDSSSLQNPVFRYNSSGTKGQKLSVITNNGCRDSTTVLRLLGDNTQPDFNWRFVCPQDTTRYRSLTPIPQFGSITQYRWKFDANNPNSAVSSGPNDTLPVHKHSNPGSYLTRLIITTNLGCVDSIQRTVSILDSITPNPVDAYLETFNNGSNFWVNTGNENANWAYVNTPQPFKNIQPRSAGDRYWQISPIDTVYKNNQVAFLNGPCVNLTQLDRPMVIMDYFSDSEEGRDGAALQYSADGGLNWFVVGNSEGSGIRWYNRRGITSKPGDQEFNQFGWSGIDTAWREARHDLNEIKALSPAAQQKIRLRIAFSSDADRPLDTAINVLDGFAIDNFRVKNRDRRVLVENFINMSASSSGLKLARIRNYLSNNRLDAAGIFYHTGFPGPDPLNSLNTADPSARALYYGISDPSRVVLNGDSVYFDIDDVFNPNSLSTLKIALTDPKVSLVVRNFDPSVADVNLQVRMRVNQAFNQPTRLHVALIESSVVSFNPRTNTVESFPWVLRRMLPSASGTFLNRNWAVGDTFLLNINEPLFAGQVENVDRLGIVAFLQNEVTGEVEQAVLDTGLNWNIVGLPDGLIEANELGIFPNPADDQLTLRFAEPVQRAMSYALVDLVGKTMLSGVLHAETQETVLSTLDLKSGMYILRLYAPDSPEQELITKKIIIQH